MEKKIIILCDLGVGGERGRVVSGGGTATSITATEYKDPQKVVKNVKTDNYFRGDRK